MTKCPVCGFKPSKKKKRPRSVQQNAYYWGCVIPIISEELGYFKEEAHEVLKTLHLSHEVTLETTEGLKTYNVVGDTKSLSTIDFEAFLAKVRSWASIKIGCYVPCPNESGYYDERTAQ